MVTVYDVQPNELINRLKEELKKESEIKAPEWISYVKSGSHTERPPVQSDFWYIRAASILRQIYVNHTVGVMRLRRHFGGRKNRGARPSHHRPAGGSIIRKLLIQLEKAGYVQKTEKGRQLTSKARKIMDKISFDIKG